MTGRCGREEVRASEERSGNDETLPGALSMRCQLTVAGPVSQWLLPLAKGRRRHLLFTHCAVKR